MSSSAAGPARTLATTGVRPRKSRGQNFLTQPRIADRIVAAAALTPDDDVIEIGPGLGILSERIAAASVRSLLLVELDRRLAAALTARFAENPRVTIINRDFLKLDSSEIPAAVNGKIIGNLPFNAAAAILERLCEYRGRIERMVLMFQREVAERIRARPGTGDYGALSVYSALYWDVQAHFRVAAGSFYPRPKVDAEVLVLTPRRDGVTPTEERRVLAAVRASFSAPRKTIRNALAGGLGIASEAAEASLRTARIDPAVRPATLAAADFVRLGEAIAPIVRDQPILRHQPILRDDIDGDA
jgi:16S rRNA (adenine1518-N6/adenine1519-N6)-dimethyltransferase